MDLRAIGEMLATAEAAKESELAELKENPHYLLWRIQNLKRGKVKR